MRAFVFFVLVTSPLALAAQEASPYVPLTHWAMPYLEHLISAGVIRDPTPLTRPLKQNAIVRALEAADTFRVGPPVRATIRRLLAEWQPPVHGPHYRVEVTLGAAAATQAVRDPLELDRGLPSRQLDRRAFGLHPLDAKVVGPAARHFARSDQLRD